jgi:hypothetical protein
MKVLRVCWAALAWGLFLGGVIGCQRTPIQGGPTPDDAWMDSEAGTTRSDADLGGSDAGPAGPDATSPVDAAASDASPAASDTAADIGPRPAFESYDEVLYVYTGTYTRFQELLITSEGDVYAASGSSTPVALVGRATKEEMDTFVEIATRPITLAAFALTDTTGCGPVADGYDELSLTIKDMPVYQRRNACPGLAELQNQAHIIRSNVTVRARDAGSP